jgi:hypothetical protein
LIQKLFNKLFETELERDTTVIREPEPIVREFENVESVSQTICEPEPEPVAMEIQTAGPVGWIIGEPEQEAQIPPRPKASEEAKAYPMLEKIKEELDKQNKIIFQAEKERNNLEIERDDLRGLQVITKKASLQRQIDSKEAQIDRRGAGLSKTVQRHGYRNVKDFYNAYYSAQKACADYIKKVKAWENTYGEEAIQKKSIRERLDNYRREVDERQAEQSVYRSDRGAR